MKYLFDAQIREPIGIASENTEYPTINTLKDDWQHEYTGPHSDMLTARKKADVVELFSYDNNGNQTRTQRNGQQYRNISYTSRNKAKRINKKGKITTFAYNGNNRRYQRVDESQQLITYYVGNLELVIDNSQSAIGEQHYIKRYAAGENIGHPTINT